MTNKRAAMTFVFITVLLDSIGFGIMVAYASYLPPKTDIPTNAFLAAVGNCVFSVFAGFNLLAQTEDEQWVLGRNLKSITLWDLYQQLPDGMELKRLKEIDDLPGVVDPLISITQFGSNEMSVSLETIFAIELPATT